MTHIPMAPKEQCLMTPAQQPSSILLMGKSLAVMLAPWAILIGTLWLLLAPAAHAQPADIPSLVKAAIEANTKGEVVVESVRATPIDGLFEVTTKGMDLFYVDRSGRYGLIDGRMVDMRDRKDLTMGRINELRTIDFRKLPLHLAIKVGNGSKVLAIFEDPTCPVCRPLHKFIAQIPDTTVYHFPYPVVTKEALPIAATAWCSPNRAEVWQRAMQGGQVPPAARPTCDISGLEQIVKAGDALNVQGTPTVFLANGKRLQGAVPPDQFLAALDESARSMTLAQKGK
jgi:thiol:disulfide interchange protein DsbC